MSGERALNYSLESTWSWRAREKSKVETKSSVRPLSLLINGKWRESVSEDLRPIFNPSTGETIAKIPFAVSEEVAEAVDAANAAFPQWKDTPITERLKYLFRLRNSFEDHLEQLSAINSENHGKTIKESRGDLRRTIDNIDSAIAVALTLSKGETFDEISRGIDESSTKEPLGVFSIICPFNFPLMIPFWFIPYAIVLGNTLVVKPSDLTPLPMDSATKIVEREVKLPPGVLNIVHGGKRVSEELIRHKEVKGVAFVGSTPVAKEIYRLAGESGKRVLSNGGAKNSIVIMPDAELNSTVPSVLSSVFGNAGQRCLAGSNVVTIGESHDDFLSRFCNSAAVLKVGDALREDSEMGPVVSASARGRIVSDISEGLEQGSRAALDGRGLSVPDRPQGFYLGGTVLDQVTADMPIAKKEIFGPVASILNFQSLDRAIEFMNERNDFGNMACIFTSNGRDARKFRREVNAGNIGINIGVASPAANFPFGGRKESFFGVLHAQIDTVDFFTDKKIIISRW